MEEEGESEEGASEETETEGAAAEEESQQKFYGCCEFKDLKIKDNQKRYSFDIYLPTIEGIKVNKYVINDLEFFSKIPSM